MAQSHHVEEYSQPISEEKFETIISENNLVIIDCFANWCGPCIGFRPIFEELSSEYLEIKFVSIDTDQTDWINARFDIDSIPRFLFFKNKLMVYEHKGASDKVVFEYFIKTKLLGKELLNELKDGISEDEFNEIIQNHSKVLFEFHPSNHQESEQLKPFYIPLIQNYPDLKFLLININNKKAKWAIKHFNMSNEYPYFILVKDGEIVENTHFHHPDTIKYTIEENLYGRTPFTHDYFMDEEKFDTLIQAYKNALVFIMKEGGRTSSIMRNFLFLIAERYPDLPIISLKLKENPWTAERFNLEDNEYTRYGEQGKKTPYFVFYKNGKIIYESGPLQPHKFEDIVQGKLLKLFSVDEYDHGIEESKFNAILEENPRVILDIFAVWCSPCVEMKPIFRDLSRNHSEIKFLSIDLDYTRWLADKFEIDSIPSFLFFNDGELVHKHIGFLEEDLFTQKIQEHLK